MEIGDLMKNFSIDEEKKYAENQKIIEAFKRYINRDDPDDKRNIILVVKKNSNGEYDNLDKKLIQIAREKEESSGIKIKIADQTEVDKKFYIFGISSNKSLKKLELEAGSINDADYSVSILVFRLDKKNKKLKSPYKDIVGFLSINSIEDDVTNMNDKKDFWKKHVEKFEGVHYISTEIMKQKK
jgi:hypothetical protein